MSLSGVFSFVRSKPSCSALLETKLARTTINTRDHRWQAEEEEGENNVRQSLGSSDDETQGSTNEYWRQSPEIRAASLKRGLEDLVADMSIREMKKRLEDLGANPRRLGSCLEKVHTQTRGRIGCVEPRMYDILPSKRPKFTCNYWFLGKNNQNHSPNPLESDCVFYISIFPMRFIRKFTHPVTYILPRKGILGSDIRVR